MKQQVTTIGYPSTALVMKLTYPVDAGTPLKIRCDKPTLFVTDNMGGTWAETGPGEWRSTAPKSGELTVTLTFSKNENHVGTLVTHPEETWE